MTTQAPPRALTDEQLRAILPLLDAADTVELKLTVPADGQRPALRALDIDPLDAQIRQVYFFDTPDLQVDAQGVVVRARRVAGKGDDTVVKLRPVVPDELSPKLRRKPGFGVEVDAMPGGFVCSASLKGVPEDADVRQTVQDGRSLSALFSKPQRALFAAHAPVDVTLDDLVPLGPVFVLKVRFVPPEMGRKLVAELWLYPDDSRILELSTKCRPGEAFEHAARLRAFLSDRGIDLLGEQETKTRKALEMLAVRSPRPS
jgi:hypothetical protein